MFCEKCGNKIEGDSRFCTSCGSAAINAPLLMKTEERPLWKRVLISIGAVLAFIIAFGTVKFIVQEGVGALLTSSDSGEQAEKNVTNYFTDTSNWKEFNSTAGQFTILFPKYPEQESETVPLDEVGLSYQSDTYGSEEGDVYYQVVVADYPPEVDVSNPKINLEGSVNGTVAAIEGELLSSNFLQFKGYQAVEYYLKQKDGSVYIKSMGVLVGSRLYNLAVAYEPKDAQNIQYQKFIDSFQLR